MVVGVCVVQCLFVKGVLKCVQCLFVGVCWWVCHYYFFKRRVGNEAAAAAR